ncbi:MAG: hypothetical protein F6J95_027545 [Leptolyngbya sp. SIO1E4]|nr:hypothetical protein [Leptolyngbya sp. SIO1E4]
MISQQPSPPAQHHDTLQSPTPHPDPLKESRCHYRTTSQHLGEWSHLLSGDNDIQVAKAAAILAGDPKAIIIGQFCPGEA